MARAWRRGARAVSRLRTGPQRVRRRMLVVLLVLVIVGVAGHAVMTYRMIRSDRPVPALQVAATVLRGPADSSGAAWAPLGTLRFALPDGSWHQLTTYVADGVRRGDTVRLWVTRYGTETAAPTRVSPWHDVAHACLWGLLAGFALLLAAATASVPLVRRGERRTFRQIVEPMRDDAARWMRELR